jgi:hypothetical protein
MWDRIQAVGLEDDLSRVIRFHNPDFHPLSPETFPNIERLLSDIQANVQLFSSSRPAVGNFTSEDLEARRESLLLELAYWFHDIQAAALDPAPPWLTQLTGAIRAENAQIVSFNWDLVLDQLLFEASLDQNSYGFGRRRSGPKLIKPHGSLNWFEHATGHYLRNTKRFTLSGAGPKSVLAFKPFRAPRSSRRRYMPLIVPPEYSKRFHGPIFKRLWQQTVSLLSTASDVRFLGYSLPEADFHARFILRCGFYNQEHGELRADGSRSPPTGRSKVTIVDPLESGPRRIEATVGWPCDWVESTIENWIDNGGLA